MRPKAQFLRSLRKKFEPDSPLQFLRSLRQNYHLRKFFPSRGFTTSLSSRKSRNPPPAFGMRPSGEEIDASALFAVRLVDKAALASHIRHSLRDASQVTLRQLVQSRPPEHGLAEIIAYLEIAHASFTITVDESAEDVLEWSGMTEDGSPIQKSARLPRVIFVR